MQHRRGSGVSKSATYNANKATNTYHNNSDGSNDYGISREVEKRKPMTYEETLRQYLKEMKEPLPDFAIGDLVTWREGFELSPYDSDFKGTGIVVEINPLTIGFFDNQSGTKGHHEIWKTIEVEGYRIIKT